MQSERLISLVGRHEQTLFAQAQLYVPARRERGAFPPARADDGGVNGQVFKVRIICERFEHAQPDLFGKGLPSVKNIESAHEETPQP
jgi:hypothetical protein